MKNKKAIIIGGIVVIVLLLLLANSLVGNPVSNSLARRATQQYINANYSDLDLHIQKAGYNFKLGEYLVLVQSPTSEDTAFTIYINSYGAIIRDDYEDEVANNFTTYRRLDNELREIAKEMIDGKLAYDFEHISILFADEVDLTQLERDMVLDIYNPPLPLAINIVLFSEDVSYSKIAEVAKALEAILKEQAVSVSEYSVRILPLENKPQKENQATSWANALAVSYFPVERMHEENLAQAMEKFETDKK